MSGLAQRRLTVEESYIWIVAREQKLEPVDGEPVMMADANRRHDRIATNTVRLFGNHLPGHRCQPFTSDTYIRIPAGNRQQADMGVDCGPFNDTALEASEPMLVPEILSPATMMLDCNDKLEEYRTVSSLEYILLIDPDVPQARLYQRDSQRRWVSQRLTGQDAVVEMPLLRLTLSLAELYAGLVFRPQPILVDPLDDPASKFSI